MKQIYKHYYNKTKKIYKTTTQKKKTLFVIILMTLIIVQKKHLDTSILKVKQNSIDNRMTGVGVAFVESAHST